MKEYLKNIFGSKTKRKIIVFFVDDYGSVRTKDLYAHRNLTKAGIKMNRAWFSKQDTLSSYEDLYKLFEVLTSVQDKYQNSACFTAFTIVANPDFKKIKDSGFTTYFREPFTQTLKHYGSDYEMAFDLWKTGIDKNIFFPAFHGTEHLNIRRWMKALQTGHKSTLLGFQNETICIPSFHNEENLNGLGKELDIIDTKENELIKDDLQVGLQMFESIFGFRAKLFAPGGSTYSPALEPFLANYGIKYLDVGRFKTQPLGNGKFSREFHYLGERNRYNQHYIIRNCIFEPGSQERAIDICLKQINAAFNCNSPAIISSHRVNFIGQFDKKFQENNLNQLKLLLEKIKKKWPDIEFMNGNQLSELLFHNLNGSF